MGTTDDATARIRTLAAHFRQHPVTGPTPGPRPPAPATPGTPLNLGMVDHLAASVAEVTAHTRAVNPAAGPRPTRADAVYDWYVANTANAPQAERQRRDTIVYRQSLEHAIAMGETKVVRPHRCPACRCLGLMWQGQLGRAVCTNRKCLAKDGTSQKWTLARLASEHIAAQYEKGVRDCAT